ncbi:MAG: aconitate hydratase AcnA [Spirochaetia bacterium]|nr:aconitate hydratase AcnA [Spirochaetia bacterium]
MKYDDKYNIKKKLNTAMGEVSYFSLPDLEKKGFEKVKNLPYSIKMILEAVVRQIDNFSVTEDMVKAICNGSGNNNEIAFKPARVIMQDFTGVPAVVDLAAMRDAVTEMKKNPESINPLLPVDLVIDHSVQVDAFASKDALKINSEKEFERNKERYEFLKWGSQVFKNFRVVPPAMGIIHQVNLEYLANVVQIKDIEGEIFAFPDSLVGTDSHTTMINALSVAGWGVGGIEAEAVMLGQPIYMLLPEVVGMKLSGSLPKGATATDLVLTITQILRETKVVGKFVEFFGPALDNLNLADRATISNMAPEYGATMGFFPIDNETLSYLRLTGRSEKLIDLIEKFAKAQTLFRDDKLNIKYDKIVELDISTIEPSLAGHKRPQDRVPLRKSKAYFYSAVKNDFIKDYQLANSIDPAYIKNLEAETPLSIKQSEKINLYKSYEKTFFMNNKEYKINHGSIVIAAITSCTNTSNPSVLIAAGILAKKAVERNLQVSPLVKTSFAPGSRAVSSYLEESGLLKNLETLGFNIVGYGCTTCIGNSGPLNEEISKTIHENNLTVCSVLSGNRNFEGRIHPDVKANYLASPPLVLAYALAGTMDIDFDTEPIGFDKDTKPVYLKELWPSYEEINDYAKKFVKKEIFIKQYDNIFISNEKWNQTESKGGNTYNWSTKSTYIRKPDFFENLSENPQKIELINNARILAVFGDSVTTDHISPAGSIKKESPAGKWLLENGIEQKDFNTYGSRRGNHEVMTRGTFANIRIKNKMLGGKEGGFTIHYPSEKETSIFDAAMLYKEKNIPLVIFAGKEYGTGSSRDWAAKGTFLLGVKAVIAESFERIHRSNLAGMGILPLQFENGYSVKALNIKGNENISILNLDENLSAGKIIKIKIQSNEIEKEFKAKIRLDTPVEIEYYKNGGILHTVLRKI